MHHVALDRSGTHDRDLDDEVVKFLRLEPRQHAHLRAAFHLEHAERIGAAEHAIDGLFFLRDRGKIETDNVIVRAGGRSSTYSRSVAVSARWPAFAGHDG